jgi:hypothetical protein
MSLRVTFGIWLFVSLLSGISECTINVDAEQSATQAPSSQQDSTSAHASSDGSTSRTKGVNQPASHKSSSASAPCPTASRDGVPTQSGCPPSSHPSKTKKTPNKHASAPNSAPTKTVVRNGGTSDPTVSLSPGVSQKEASHLQDTNELLATSDTNLRELAGRQLTPEQQDSVKQIRNYMSQAKQAEESGDLQRAHNLANKAELLSAELAGQ